MAIIINFTFNKNHGISWPDKKLSYRIIKLQARIIQYSVDDLGIRVQIHSWVETFFSTALRIAMSDPASYSTGTRVLSPWVKWLGCENDH
jgi:hypothetical protein